MIGESMSEMFTPCEVHLFLSKRTTLHSAKPPHAGLQLPKYHVRPERRSSSEPRPEGLTLHSTGHQNHQTLPPRPPER